MISHLKTSLLLASAMHANPGRTRQPGTTMSANTAVLTLPPCMQPLSPAEKLTWLGITIIVVIVVAGVNQCPGLPLPPIY
jgi:hypothetical protein